ncbi:protein kinase domain-containing protein [Mesoterricola silvestris]|uniref:protein kinase domain-containing protein n=1 Tax=Mesoterricola silvestris TaxID=2927979 RepID=UPI00292DCA9B|nr:protein kinase [Mesoterricola silvestris]
MLGPLLGKGGAGEVLEAWDALLCRTVALKALRDMDPGALIRFMHEAQLQARVIHPNICRIYDIESAGRTLKISMQLIKGPNLEQAAPQLSPAEAVGILRSVAEAVHAAHRVNLIHRDLKPSNIILERGPGGAWIPYLCDFGLAVSLGDPPLTLSQVAVGTPAFMAPEQSRGGRDRISPATDVFALGGTLHFALLGFPPGPPGTPPGPLRSGQGDLPRDLALVIRKCLEPDPGDRYATALALAADLDRFLRGIPVHARPRGPLGRFLGFLPGRGSRMLALGWFLAALGLTLAAGAGLALLGRTREEALVRDLEAASGVQIWNQPADLALPLHDLRSSRNRLRTRMAQVRAHMGEVGPGFRGPAWFALAQAHLLLGEEAEACAALRSAAALGYDEELLAPLMIRALAEAAYWRPGAAPDPSARRWARLGSAAADPGPLQEGRAAFILGDYSTAARLSREAAEASPDSPEAAALQCAALCALGRRALGAGEVTGARTLFQEAADTAWRRVAVWASSPGLRHAFARAALALADLEIGRGTQSPEALRELSRRCEEALRMDPGDRILREDWLASRFLVGRHRATLDLDPRPVLREALAFLESRPQRREAPGPDGLRMAILWQIADWEFTHAGNPGPALGEALASRGPAPAFGRDYQAALLVLRARVDAARGQDPRPAVEAALRHLGAADTWDLAQAAAEAWYLRAVWEAAHSVDPSASLGRVRALADRALGDWAGAPEAAALKGLAEDLERKAGPARGTLLASSAIPPQKPARASARGPGAGVHLERALPGLP